MRARTSLRVTPYTPGSTVAGRVVHDETLKTVECIRKAGRGCLSSLELGPTRVQPFARVRRKESEETHGSLRFTICLASVRGFVECEGVARVDLHDVMHDEHLEHATEIGARRRVLEQRQSHRGEMPRMLGAVLETRPVDEGCSTEHRLQSVQLPDEIELTLQPGWSS